MPKQPRTSDDRDRTAFERAEAAAAAALAAEEREDWWAVDAAWARYRLIRDSMRDPDELLAEGVELSRFAARTAPRS